MSARSKTETNVKHAVPFFRVRDMSASLRFYVDGLGFVMTNQWMHQGRLRWCSLRLGDVAVMLQEFWSEGPNQNLPDGEVGIGVSICFECADALALYRELRSRGVNAKRPFVGNGMWDVTVVDPDGYRLSFESPTDLPEETEYSE
jgi:catechol 2,3-dioxygenase-like lactoylglutathione lyase family enzyme